MPNYYSADKLVGDFPTLLEEGLKDPAARDLCALECYANEPLYAKPDSQKDFILWEAKMNDENPDGIKIYKSESACARHPWVFNLFLGKVGFVRFPFNAFDSVESTSLSWGTIEKTLQVTDKGGVLLELPRWSTASRSCFVLIPESSDQLVPGLYFVIFIVVCAVTVRISV